MVLFIDMINFSILWDPNPVIIEIFSFPIRWYSLFWIVALFSGTCVVHKVFKQQQLSEDNFNLLCIYAFFGILIGARLGHCIFYDADYYLQHPLEIILPVRILPNDKIVFTGYAGLASHGGTIGLFLSLYLYHLKSKIRYIEVLDIIAIAAPLAAGFIRIANFMNSEIIGLETNMPWGVVFVQVDDKVRHPAQIYEALAYFSIFLILWTIYNKHKHRKPGFYLGACIFMIFTFRFVIEFLKERQVDFEYGMLIDMGQILSIPFILLGLYLLVRK